MALCNKLCNEFLGKFVAIVINRFPYFEAGDDLNHPPITYYFFPAGVPYACAGVPTSPLAFGVMVFARPPLPRPASADPVVGLAGVVVEAVLVLLAEFVVALLDCAIA